MTNSPGTAIALRNKDIELKSFYREASQGAGHVAGEQRVGGLFVGGPAGRRPGRAAGPAGPSTELAGSRGALDR